MYKVYLDGSLLYHPNVKQLPIEKTKLSLEVNKTGTFKFQIRKQNQNYSSIKKMKSIISVYDDNFRLFRGRVLNTTKGMFNELQVTCEGELAFLLDSRQRPFEFTGSVGEYFTFLIERHNTYVTDSEKRFKVGRVTVTDPNDYIVRSDSKYTNTLDLILDGLVNKLGGFLWTREESDGIYIDYLEDFELTNTQEIKFGENLISFEEVIKGQDIATVIIPLGCKLTDENGNETGGRLTIAAVNNGLDYVFDQASVNKYGWIEKIVEWDDVTLESNLLKKANEELQNTIHPIRSINLTAVDLHHVNCDIQSFRYGRYAKIISKPHSLDESLLVRKIELNLQSAKDGYLNLGDERKTFVDHQLESDKNLSNVVNIVEKNYQLNQQQTSDKVNQAENNMLLVLETNQSAILQAANEIILSALTSYTQTSDFETFKKTLESTLQLLADEMTLKFTETTAQIEDVNGDLQATNTTLSKYFEFTIDGLVIKSGESEITLHIDNDMIMFKKNGVMFGWWDGTDFHTGNIVVEVNERAQFGNFAFVPRSDGSLAFLKVDNEVLANKLISISAKYTGGDVAAGTSLSNLTGITVTATYSDGSTENVTNYTLSGSIQEGSNTITVTYQEKTARFTVVGITNTGIILGEATPCVVHAWISTTAYAINVKYSDSVEVIDGAVSLVSEQSTSFYMTTGTGYNNNNYEVLKGKYVKSINGIYYIDPSSTYEHKTNVSAYVKENLVYNTAYLVSVAD